jgi:hypothetical protein
MGSRDDTKSRTISPRTVSGANPAAFDGILDAALKIAASRREALTRLREALTTNDTAEVFRIAKELCGLHTKKSD